MNWFSRWLYESPRRRILRKTKIDEALWRQVESHLEFLRPLDPDERRRLREMAILFLHDKQMYGAADLDLSDAMRLSIALQACLPILNLGLAHYAGWVGVIVYPGGFRVRREQMDEHGIVHEWADELAGETSADGPVVLSWEDVADTQGHYNVVIHEFAHKLDMLDKLDADGFPLPHADMPAREWLDTLESAYAQFCRAVDRGAEKPGRAEDFAPLDNAGNPLPFDAYAAQDPAEFFAVMSEVFFVSPGDLQAHYRRLYEQFRLFYRQDPLARVHRKAAS